MPDSYRATQADFCVGTSSAKADLIGSLDGPLVLTGTVETDRRRVIGSGGTIGLTADGVNCGFTATASLRYTSESKKLLSMVDAVCVIRRRDADWAYAVPVVVSAVPVTSAAGAIVSIALTLTQSAEGGAVSGKPATSGSQSLTSGQEGYVVSAGKVERRTATFTVAANSWAVSGDPIVAEG